MKMRELQSLEQCRRLENNLCQLIARREAGGANERDRFWDFNETKSSAVRESEGQQMRYARRMFEIESCERRVEEEAMGCKNGHFPTNTKSL
jgi:hypothetical protein